MSVLIYSFDSDVHARAVIWALARLGVQAQILDTGRYLTTECMSLRLGGSEPFSQQNSLDRFGDVQTIWWRRPTAPTIEDKVHPADIEFVARERRCMLAALKQCFRGARWVNNSEASVIAEDKFYQLQTAREVGLTVVETLFSNDPDEIANFERDVGKIIYKPFTPASWEGDDTRALYFTAPFSVGNVASPESLRLCPGIYQRALEKQYELRVNVMDDHVVAARLDIIGDIAAQNDWRAARTGAGQMRVTPYALPIPVENMCIALTRSLGLRFGAMDLIKSRELGYVFLEVNQAGQFLWIERLCPEIRMLRDFALTLCGDGVERQTERTEEITISKFREQDLPQAVQGDRRNPYVSRE